jgi:hypothetical protein
MAKTHTWPGGCREIFWGVKWGDMKILVKGDSHFLRLEREMQQLLYYLEQKCYFNTTKIGEVNMTIE